MTPAEQLIVSRRAHGEYGIIPNCAAIWRGCKGKERTVYVKFLAIIFSGHNKGYAVPPALIDAYNEAASAVIAASPHPHGLPVSERVEVDTPLPAQKPKRHSKKTAAEPAAGPPVEVSADLEPPARPTLKKGLAGLRAALRADWPTRDLASKVKDQ
ncbi:MAG TPA: hypothetical protein VFH61_18430 [Thermoleophilia bacterium]|nr:hypothetical protein [Thermoleophilia bacterium]